MRNPAIASPRSRQRQEGIHLLLASTPRKTINTFACTTWCLTFPERVNIQTSSFRHKKLHAFINFFAEWKSGWSLLTQSNSLGLFPFQHLHKRTFSSTLSYWDGKTWMLFFFPPGSSFDWLGFFMAVSESWTFLFVSEAFGDGSHFNWHWGLQQKGAPQEVIRITTLRICTGIKTANGGGTVIATKCFVFLLLEKPSSTKVWGFLMYIFPSLCSSKKWKWLDLWDFSLMYKIPSTACFKALEKRYTHLFWQGGYWWLIIQDCCSHSKNLSMVYVLAHARDGQNVLPFLFIFP